MTTPASRQDFRIRYEKLLEDYLNGTQEASLEQAYEVGRHAIAHGIGILEVIQLHSDALHALRARLDPFKHDPFPAFRRAQAFLFECLAPFEIAYRGFRDANASLRQLIRELEEVNAAIARAHRREETLSHASWSFSQSLNLRQTIQAVLAEATRDLSRAGLIEILTDRQEHQVLAARAGEEPTQLFVHPAGSPQCLLASPGSSDPDEAVRRAFATLLGEGAGKGTPPAPRRFELKTQHGPLGVLFLLGPERTGASPLAEGSGADAFLAEFVRRAGVALENAHSYQEAQNAIRAREDMLKIVAHDLRNPLSSIKLNTDIVLRQLDRTCDPARIRAILTITQSAARRMEKLVEDILDLARIEAHKFLLDLKECTVERLVAEATEAMKPAIEQRKLTLRTEVLCPEQAMLCDSGRILQVFANLVGNAIKYTPEGGTITVRAKLLEDCVLFSVWDTGYGISPDELPHVFDRLWQARPGSHAGIGFGLYIARTIIEAHGGAICPDSIPGKGTTFFFTLPLADVARGRIPGAQDQAA